MTQSTQYVEHLDTATIGRRELAAEWGISPSQIDNLLRKGTLRTVVRGKIDYEHAQRARRMMDPVRTLAGRIRADKMKAIDESAMSWDEICRWADEIDPEDELSRIGLPDLVEWE
jgi:hypothetical protein